MGKRSRSKNAPEIKAQAKEPPFSLLIPPLLKIIFPALIIALITLGVFLRMVNLNNVTMRSPDEKVYTYQSRIISAEGPITGTRALVREYNQVSQLWIYPPPTRIGYDWLLGGIMKLSGSNNEKTGAYLSFAASILSLILIAVIGLRFFDPLVTLFALLFMAVSPMDLTISRRSWQDALFGFLGLAMVYYVLEITKDAKKLIWYILLIVTGMYIVLVKEPGVAVYGLCSLWVVWILAAKERSFPGTLIFIAASGAGLIASYAIMSYAVGGINTLCDRIPIRPMA
jgi:4-amino-4-deoxy-L-arabinose transferase-like glycosyltransferase